MDSLKTIDTKNLHHAYLIEDQEGIFDNLQILLKSAHKGAEIHIREFGSFGIDDSRELMNLARMRSLGTQLFIYKAQTFTREAQNALLKLFEEPPKDTHFFICLSGVINTLPTLRSRAWVIDSVGVSSKGDLGKDFIKASVGERINLLEKIVKDKDVSMAENFLRDIELELYKQKLTIKYSKAQQHIIDVRRLIRDRGASLKILMESVALVVPNIS